MMRVPDWRTRLLAWGTSQVGTPYVWGQTDCASLARRALEQMFGRDVLAHLPTWTTARAALEVVQQYGTPEAILAGMGAQSVTLPFMRAGDIVVAPFEPEQVGRVALFVCLDRRLCLGAWPQSGVYTMELAVGVPGSRAYSLWEVPRG